jgi:adenine-specific DNA glycosylase
MWNIGSKLCAKDRCLECPVKELCARYQSGSEAN